MQIAAGGDDEIRRLAIEGVDRAERGQIIGVEIGAGRRLRQSRDIGDEVLLGQPNDRIWRDRCVIHRVELIGAEALGLEEGRGQIQIERWCRRRISTDLET